MMSSTISPCPQRLAKHEPSLQVEDALARAQGPSVSSNTEREAPAAAEIEQHKPDNLPAAQEPISTPAAATAPRKMKLHPGDFYISLPRPPTAEHAPSLPQSSERETAVPETLKHPEGCAPQGNGHTELQLSSLVDTSGSAQPAGPSVTGAARHEQQDQVQASTAYSSLPNEAQLEGRAAPAGGESAGDALESANASSPEATQQPVASQNTSAMSDASKSLQQSE